MQGETTLDIIRQFQTEFLQRIKPPSTDASFQEFCSLRQRLQWIVHSCPDFACAVNKASQITADNFGPSYITFINKSVCQGQIYPERGIRPSQIGKNYLYIRVYTDGSFGDYDDLSTRVCFIVFLCDKNRRCNILHFSIHKSRFVVYSDLGGENSHLLMKLISL